MLHRTLALALFACTALLTACSGPRHSLGRPLNEVAVVNGASQSGFTLLGLDATIRIVSIDGEALEKSAMNGYPEVVEVLPGHHTLEAWYSSWVDGSPGPSGEAKLEFDALAGRRYRILLVGGAPNPLVIELEPAK